MSKTERINFISHLIMCYIFPRLLLLTELPDLKNVDQLAHLIICIDNGPVALNGHRSVKDEF
jgi:hypothetical protein